jgi:hypothetical protein
MLRVQFSDTLKPSRCAQHGLKSGKLRCQPHPLRSKNDDSLRRFHRLFHHRADACRSRRACGRNGPRIRHRLVRLLQGCPTGDRRPLGRSFKVKLWPTLIFLRDGVEIARVVRPTEVQEVADGLKALG